MKSRVIAAICNCAIRDAGLSFFAPMKTKNAAVHGLQSCSGLLISNINKGPDGISFSNGQKEVEHLEMSADVARPLRHITLNEGRPLTMPQWSVWPKLTAARPKRAEATR